MEFNSGFKGLIVCSYTEAVISVAFNMGNEECIIVMSAGRKVKKKL